MDYSLKVIDPNCLLVDRLSADLLDPTEYTTQNDLSHSEHPQKTKLVFINVTALIQFGEPRRTNGM
jgi:hypothetical protein